MAKNKRVYVCQECGAEAAKWIGRCPSCGEWNTYTEEITRTPSKHENKNALVHKYNKASLLSEVDSNNEFRWDMCDAEFNRVLGGGLVPGSLVLIGGEPGIGKSTLLLQVALQLNEYRVLYVSGEESPQQIRMRADRLQTGLGNCYILCESNLEHILKQVELLQPDILVIDSVQTLHSEQLESAPGTVSQIRACASDLLQVAKATNMPVLLIGHINKEGQLAGPKVLEHAVDTVLQFEGDRHYLYRILRSIKNRFGSTAELGIYQMQQNGLRQVSNPSELLISPGDENLSGVAISASIEGARPFLIEVQALVSSAAYGTPQRSATGFDLRRLAMLLAVLEKRAGFRLAAKDVFLNMAGGLKVDDTAIDLAVVCAVLSSDQDITIPKNFCFTGEVGLSGEVRPVVRIEQRIAEARKLGFSDICLPVHNKKSITRQVSDIRLHFVHKVADVFDLLFT